MILYPKNIFRFIPPVHVHLKMDCVDYLKKPSWKKKKFLHMKNVVECWREFFAYFNTLETYSVYGY
jgi:hypothetical protein